MKRYTLVVMYNAVEELEAQFNERLERVHVPEMLEVEGIVSARRLRLAYTQSRPDNVAPHEYCTLYEIETDDIEAFHERLMETKHERSASPVRDHVDDCARYFEVLSEQEATG